MALSYFDGFEDYNASQIERNYWVGGRLHPGTITFEATGIPTIGIQFIISTAHGRNGTNGIGWGVDNGGTLYRRIGDNTTTRISIGAAFRYQTTGENGNHIFTMGSFVPAPPSGPPINDTMIGLLVNGSESLLLVSEPGSDLFGHPNYALMLRDLNFQLAENVFYHIEFAIDLGTGVVTVAVNSQTILNEAVAGWGPPGVYAYLWYTLGMQHNGGGALDYDDFWADDEATLWGDARIYSLFPNADGDKTQWTRGGTDTGADFSQVNEHVADDLTTYIDTGTVGNTDLFVFDTLSASGTVGAVMTVMVAQNDSAGAASIAADVKSGGTEFLGPDQALSSGSWNAFMDIWPLDPFTTNPWLIAGINAAQFGVQRTV